MDFTLSNVTKAQNLAPHFLIMIFFAITFLQSAIDKAMDWNGNLAWLNGHFKNSPLGSQVKVMLGALTLVEFASGLSCAYALVRLLNSKTDAVSCALTICGVNLLMLLFGQRLAKDYAGAATIGQYMILVIAGFLLI